MEIRLVPILENNYVFLLRDSSGTAVAAVDPGEAEPVGAALDELGWHLTHIFNTHHHADHTGGNRELARRFGARVIGAHADRNRIPAITADVDDGDALVFGADRALVMATPGHTSGHIAFEFPESKALFCGDTLFVLGCGRMFEGTAAQMWASLYRLRTLPDATRVYCAHEYAESNARFALSVNPGNAALQAQAAEIARLRAEGKPTVPSTIGRELRANPFLRADQPDLQEAIGMRGSGAVEVFAELRRRKDVFRG